MDTFASLGVSELFAEKLKERSIEKPTEIQSLVIPRLLEGKSLLFRSATGTGKTFAYLLPALQSFFSENSSLCASSSSAPLREKKSESKLAVLVCAPTLELCSQINEEIEFLASGDERLSSLLLIGSVKIEKQIEMLKRARPVIVVGNPGRLLVLARMGKIKLGSLKFLILDEADRLTVHESLEDTKGLLSIIEREAKRRPQNNLCAAACSATASGKTCEQLGALFENAEIIESDDNEILREKIEHWAIFSEKRRKVQALRSLLSALNGKKKNIKALVFTSRGDEAGKILSQLLHHHVKAAGLIGKINRKPQSGQERKAALDAFREGRAEVLISTDLAARGLDITGISHVIALDVPADSEQYIHRCGRTGRAGKRGTMVTIGDETQMRLLASMEKKLKIRVMPKELYEGKVCVPHV